MKSDQAFLIRMKRKIDQDNAETAWSLVNRGFCATRSLKSQGLPFDNSLGPPTTYVVRVGVG